MGGTGEQQSAQAAIGNEGHRSAEGWNRGQAMLQGFMAPAIARMLDICGLEEGWRVLDVAAGTGIQTFEIAKSIGPFIEKRIRESHIYCYRQQYPLDSQIKCNT